MTPQQRLQLAFTTGAVLVSLIPIATLMLVIGLSLLKTLVDWRHDE